MSSLRGILSGRVQHMAAGELLAMIPSATVAAIKRTDPSPEFRAYCIAHEGEAAGNLVGFGRAVIQYFRDVVGRIYDRLAPGTPIFRGHNADNSTAGRQAIGQVVGKSRTVIDGKESVLAAVYVAPEARADRLDVCSIEANIVFTDSGGGKARAVEVETLTGIALGDSQNDVPGFPGAQMLAALQAFAKNEEERMTKEEVIQAIKELGLTVSDLFAADVLREDKAVSAIVEEATAKERGYGSRQTAKVEKLEQKISEMEAAHESALNEAKAESTRAKSRGVLDTVIGERKLDDSQKKFIERNWKTFETKATDDAGLKGDLDRFLDAQLAEHRSLASEIYGIKSDEKGGAQTPPGDNSTAGFGPGNNPLIPV